MSSKRPHEGSMSNKRQRSEVWGHFKKTSDGKRAICRYCGKSLGANSKGGTSHLKRHLKLCMKQPTGDIGQPVTLESTHARNIGDAGQPAAVTLEFNHEAINIGDVGQPVTLESNHEAMNIGDVGQLVTLQSTHGGARNFDDVGQPVTLESNHEAINIGDVGQLVTLESNYEARNIGLTRDITWKDEVKKAILAEIPFASSDFKNCWYSSTGLMDIEREIRTYYELEKEKLAIELKNLPSRISFSFQIMKELGYISITAHFINADFNLVRRLIGFKKLTDPESKSCVVDAIKSCISEWNLGDKIFTFVRGNSPYIYGMKESLKECFSSKLLFNGNFIYYECRKKVLIDFYSYCIGPLCYHEHSKIGKFVRHVKEVSGGMDIFNKLAGEKHLPPINTDWLNEYTGCSWDVDSEDSDDSEDSEDPADLKPAIDMFKQALKYKDVFNRYTEIGPSMTVNGESLMLDNGHPHQLDNTDYSFLDTHVEVGQSPHSELNMCSIDWERVEEAICFSDLTPKVIDGLSTSNYPTSNLYFPNLMEIDDIVSNIGNPIEIEKSGGKQTYDLEAYFYHELRMSIKLFEIATVLDPRYRLEFVNCLSENSLFTMHHIESCEEVFRTYANDEINKGSPECIENTNTQEQGPPCNSAHFIGGTIANKFYKYVKEKKETRKSELDKYLDDELVELDDASFNILSWWKQNRSQYPILSRMARDILAVPTCAYSIEGIISSDFESVNPQLVEAVICSKDWILSDV